MAAPARARQGQRQAAPRTEGEPAWAGWCGQAGPQVRPTRACPSRVARCRRLAQGLSRFGRSHRQISPRSGVSPATSARQTPCLRPRASDRPPPRSTSAPGNRSRRTARRNVERSGSASVGFVDSGQSATRRPNKPRRRARRSRPQRDRHRSRRQNRRVDHRQDQRGRGRSHQNGIQRCMPLSRMPLRGAGPIQPSLPLPAPRGAHEHDAG